MPEGRQLLTTEHGVIEAHILQAAAGHTGQLAAVVLHPWARLGGCMDDPTVVAVCRALWASGAFRCIARYNMQGAGATSYSGSPAGVAELQEVCRHLLSLLGPPPHSLYVVGYSYGSCIASHAMELFPQAVRGYAGIGYPLGFWANLLLSSRTHWQQLAAAPTTPKLLIAGTHDNFTSLELFQEYAQELQQQAGPDHQQLVEVQVLQGADHFYAGRWDEVASLVLDWVMKQEARAADGSQQQ